MGLVCSLGANSDVRLPSHEGLSIVSSCQAALLGVFKASMRKVSAVRALLISCRAKLM